MKFFTASDPPKVMMQEECGLRDRNPCYQAEIDFALRVMRDLGLTDEEFRELCESILAMQQYWQELWKLLLDPEKQGAEEFVIEIFMRYRARKHGTEQGGITNLTFEEFTHGLSFRQSRVA
jgi:hypothetical protein